MRSQADAGDFVTHVSPGTPDSSLGTVGGAFVETHAANVRTDRLVQRLARVAMAERGDAVCAAPGRSGNM